MQTFLYLSAKNYISSKFYIKITLLGSKNLLFWEKIVFEGPNTFHNKLSINQKKI